MFKFEHPEYLYFLWAIPIFLGLVALFWRWRGQAVEQFGSAALVDRLMPGFSSKRLFLKATLFAVAVALLCIAWANPQRGAKREKVSQKSADIFLALDISQSMLAEDIAPSRLERAKVFGQKIVQSLPGQRIGLIFFAGSAYLQMPLSTDYSAAVSFLRSASPDMVSEQGTAISEVLELAEKAFDPNIKGGRAVIIITDGETHDEDAIANAEKAYNDGTLIFGIGVGTSEGGTIPVGIGISGTTVKRDENGAIVKTKLNEKLLYDLAKAGGGSSYNLSQGDPVINNLKKAISQLEKREVEARSYSEFESYFQWFLLPGLLLLVLEFLLPWKKNMGRNTNFLLIMGLVSMAIPAQAQSGHTESLDGDRQYQKKEYKKAEEHYRKAIEKTPESPNATYNLGNSVYQQGRYDQSTGFFERAVRLAKTNADKADAFHNLGNAWYGQAKYKEAVDAFQNSLRLRPGDEETKHNLQLAKKKLEEEKKKQQEQQKQDQQKDQNKDPNKDQKQDPKDQQKPQDQQKQQEQQQKDQQKQEQQQQQQPQAGKMSKQEALRLLETAIEPEDQKNGKKYRAQPRARRKSDKDW